MKTVLVPVDFSDTSINAAVYAVKMFTGVYGINMILYNVYEKSEHKESSEQELKELKKKLFDAGIVKMQTLSEPGHNLIDQLSKTISETKTDLVIMGITGRNKVEQTLIGSNTLKIVERKHCPVQIVPPGAKFSQVKNIALTSDFMSMPSPSTVKFIQNILSSFFAKLHIVNVNPAIHVSLTEEQQQTRAQIDQLFTGFEREFYFIGLYDLQETLNIFVKDHKIDMIITMPKDHSWLHAMLGTTHTKKMAYQSTVPVLALHQ